MDRRPLWSLGDVRASLVITAISARLPVAWQRRVSVFAGGLIGTGMRFGLAEAVAALGVAGVWGTLLVNLSGALALGFVVGRRLARTRPGTLLVPFLGIGLLGSFTTFSGFSYEVADLLDAGRWQLGLGYAVGSIAAGLMLALLGERWGGRT